MALTLDLFILEFLTKVVIGTVICLSVVLLGLKLWLQPVKRRCQSNVTLDGKVALITGGNSGIGLETARDLARRGATVVIASRDEKRSEEAVQDIIATTGNTKVHHKRLDLAKFSSIKEFVEDFNKSYDRLDILVNNSGCGALKPTLSEDGIEKVTQINYVGPFLLTHLLLDKLISSKPSRIVIVSSVANEYHNFKPDDIAGVRYIGRKLNFVRLFQIYGNTKLCGILWAKALAKRLPEGVTVNALHPGVVNTNIFKNMENVSRTVVYMLINSMFKTAEEGAQTSIYLSVDPELDGVSGEYFFECKPTKADKLTRDDQLIEKVWENTMKLISGK